MDAGGSYHEGERYVQERAGERDRALRLEGFTAGPIPIRALAFLAEQRMLAIGSVDEHGTVFASVIFGTPGLASSVDGLSLQLDRTRDAQVLVIAGRNDAMVTLNLKAPIVLNLQKRLGAQVVHTGEEPLQFKADREVAPLRKSA